MPPRIATAYGLAMTGGGLEARRDVRVRHPQVRAVVPGQPGMGELPRNKMKLVQAWLEIHREEIMADWTLAVRGLPPQKIKPLE